MQHKYGQDYDQFAQMPVPQPNEFMAWLFSSGILTDHQKDLIRARMAAPAAPAGTVAPGAPATTGAPVPAPATATPLA